MLEEFAILPRYGADVIFRPFYNFTKTAVLIFLFVLVIIGKDRVMRLAAKLGADKLFYRIQKILPGKKLKKGIDNADKK